MFQFIVEELYQSLDHCYDVEMILYLPMAGKSGHTPANRIYHITTSMYEDHLEIIIVR